MDAFSTVNWTAGDITVSNGITVTNAGTFLARSAGTMGGNLNAGQQWTFQNNGDLIKIRANVLDHVRPLAGVGSNIYIRAALDGTDPNTSEFAGTVTQDQTGTLTSVESGTLLVTGSFSQSEGDVTVKGGTILSVTGGYTEGADGTLNVYLKTPTSGSGQVSVGGTVSLAGRLNITALSGFSCSPYTLISNTGSSAIAGAYFQGLAQGAVLSVGGSNFQISYVGGTDGRDVVLSSVSNPITLTSSANPGYNGHSLTFTATVTPSSATGNVDFYDNGADVGDGTLSGGVATYTTSSLAVGTHLIKAYYGGDGSNGSSSVNLTQAVLSTPTIISADNAQFTMGSAATFTIVTNGSPNSTFAESGSLPSGVTFTDNGDGTATLSGTPASGTVGNYTLTLSTADNGVSGGSTQTFVLTVNKATPTVSVTDAGGVYTGSAFSATATVAGVLAGVDTTPASSLESVTPTLTYYSVSAPGVPLAGAPSAVGSYAVLASFAGSTNYTSADNAATFSIDAARVTALSRTTGPSAGGYTVTITGVGFTGATYVNFGNAQAPSITVNSDTSITATAPPHTRVAVDVTVTNSYGISPTSSADVFTYINGAPSGANHTASTFENSYYTFAASDFGFTDLSDGPADAFLAVRITTLPSVGTLTLNGSAVSAGQFISVSDINSGFLRFTPTANTYGTSYDAFTFQVQDNGGTANGGIDLDPIARIMTINVTPL